MKDKTVPAPSAQVAALESRLARSEQRLRVLCVLLALGFGLAVVAPLATPAFAQGGITLAQLAARLTAAETNITALQTKTQDMTRLTDLNTGKPTVRFSAVNVQIVNGSGEMTAADGAAPNPVINGLGNLILGYNKKRADNTDDRNGSHMLIVGDFQNYSATAASGIVSGYGSAVSGIYSNAAGYRNAAYGIYCNVSGGAANAVLGVACSVSGGGGNVANGTYCSISGGDGSATNGLYSSISGGAFNTASGQRCNVSGGFSNIASGDYSSVIGGGHNTASGMYSSVSGGWYNTAQGDLSAISGGQGNRTFSTAGSVSGGSGNTAAAGYSSISGGYDNTTNGAYSAISGGLGKTQSNMYGWTGGIYYNP